MNKKNIKEIKFKIETNSSDHRIKMALNEITYLGRIYDEEIKTLKNKKENEIQNGK